MLYTINELRQKVFSKVYAVYEVFQNFFEPQFVDLQGIPTDEDLINTLSNWDLEFVEGRCEIPGPRLRNIKSTYSSLKPVIMVWWPRVTVTNENDRSIQIQDLYAKVTLTMEGRIPYECRGFQLNRTTFVETQFASGYLHSHIPHFSGVPIFANPCLGTGPINNTIMDLKNGYEETLWMLFCQELALYVTVESLRGGPYFRMEQVGSERELYGFTGYDDNLTEINSLYSFCPATSEKRAELKELVRRFTLYYLEQGHLALNYKDGQFVPGMTYFDFMIDISNAFIDFFNQHSDRDSVEPAFQRGILVRAIAANNKFYESRSGVTHDFSQYEGQNMFEFKGEMKHLHIIQEAHTTVEATILLNHKIAMFILNNVLKIINYRYRNEYNNQLGDSASSAVAPTYQTVIYL